MGWFDKKPPGPPGPPAKDEPTAPRPADMPRADAPTTEQELVAHVPPSQSQPPADSEGPRGLAALFGQRAESAPSAGSAHAGSASPGSASQAASESASVFAESVEIEGSLEGEGDVYLRGQVRGSISITGMLVVSETGRVHADVAAREVVCGGTVEGNILATEKVRVQGSGLVQGDIDSPSIVIEDGGGVEGFVQMAPQGGDDPDEHDAPTPTSSPAPPPAAGRLGRTAAARPSEGMPAQTLAIPAALPMPLAPGPSTGAEGPQKLTREMLLGLSGSVPPPAAGLLNRPATVASSPASGPAGASGSAPLDIFTDEDGPLGGDVLGGGNGSDGPLLPPDEQLGAEPQKRSLPEL